jgi:DNA-binding response OmpR family regulator
LNFIDGGADDPSMFKGLRILVVEDASVVADSIQSLLQETGMVVIGPVSTSAAAKQMMMDSPDVALVDVLLADDTGYGLVEQLRGDGVPVVMMSGLAQYADPGPNFAILQKPFSGEELLRALRQVIA